MLSNVLDSNCMMDTLCLIDKCKQIATYWHVIRLLIIITISGAAGGLVNYYFDKYPLSKVVNDSEVNELMKPWQYVFVGIAAAFVVPVLLLSTKSNLLNESGTDAMSYFVIAGFCIAASISARAFLNSMSSKLKGQIEKSEKILTEIKEEHKEAKELLEQEIEPTDAGIVRELAEIDDNDKLILDLLNKNSFKFVSINSLTAQSNLNIEALHVILNKLIREGFVDQREFDGRTRFFITTKGKLSITPAIG